MVEAWAEATDAAYREAAWWAAGSTVVPEAEASPDSAEDCPNTRATRSGSCRRQCKAAESSNGLQSQARMGRHRLEQSDSLPRTRCSGTCSGSSLGTAHVLRGCGSTLDRLHCKSRTCTRDRRNIGDDRSARRCAPTGTCQSDDLVATEAEEEVAATAVADSAAAPEAVARAGAATAEATEAATEGATAAESEEATAAPREAAGSPDLASAAAQGALAAAPMAATKEVGCSVAVAVGCTAQAHACDPPSAQALLLAEYHTPSSALFLRSPTRASTWRTACSRRLHPSSSSDLRSGHRPA